MEDQYVRRCELNRVIDGDTVVLDVDLGFRVVKKGEPFRLFGIDAPEMYGRRASEKGKLARAALVDKLTSATKLTVQSSRHGKFRWLAIVYADGENVNEWMIEQGHATVYPK